MAEEKTVSPKPASTVASKPKAAETKNVNGEEDAKIANQAKVDDAQRRAQAETNPGKAARIAASAPDHSASTMTLGGVTKILREEGSDNSGKPVEGPVVQQGGGGAIPAKG